MVHFTLQFYDVEACEVIVPSLYSLGSAGVRKELPDLGLTLVVT